MISSESRDRLVQQYSIICINNNNRDREYQLTSFVGDLLGPAVGLDDGDKDGSLLGLFEGDFDGL